MKFEHAKKDKKRIRVEATEAASDRTDRLDRTRAGDHRRGDGPARKASEEKHHVKPDIHPKYYQAKVHCGSCGTEWIVGSTREELRVDVCANCHPFFTGKQNDHRHRRPGRALPEAARATGPQLSPSTRPPSGRRSTRRVLGPAVLIPGGTIGRGRSRAKASRLPGMPRFTYGGQALIEGVLMRGRDAIAVALRHPDGRIVFATERLDSGFHGTTWSKLPLIRGLVVLYETLIIGTRWLVRSANVQAQEEGVELGKGAIALMLGITLLAGVGVFFLLPLFLASVTDGQRRERADPALRRGPDPRRAVPRLPGAHRARRPTSGASSCTTAPST